MRLPESDRHPNLLSPPGAAAEIPGVVEIDGSLGEGGGQVLRTSLSLSVLTGRPVRLTRIRARRAKPGLRAQHLKAVEAAGAVSRARIEGAALGSDALLFEPRGIHPGEFSFDIGTAGSTSLVLQTILVPLGFAGAPSTVVLTGGTHVPWSPCFHYLDLQWMPHLRRIGFEARLTLELAGFYPRGGGRIRAVIEPPAALAPLLLAERGSLVRIRGVSAVAGLDRRIAERQKRRALERLAGLRTAATIEVVDLPAGSPGTLLLLMAEFEHSRCCYCGLGARGKPAECVADEAADGLFSFLTADGAVDPWLADQLVLPLALVPAESRLRTAVVTGHLLTVAQVVKAFLPAQIEIAGDPGRPGTVRIRGVGLRLESRLKKAGGHDLPEGGRGAAKGPGMKKSRETLEPAARVSQNRAREESRMANTGRLSPELLCHSCDARQFSFETTEELETLSDVVGQPRAVEAVQFGIGIRQPGYNIFALGPEGMGKLTIVRRFLEQKAATEPTPSDWCYVNNFDDPQKPRVLRMPIGRGAELREDVARLIDELRAAIPAAFETEEYRARRQVIESEVKEKQQDAFEQLRSEAEKRGIAVAHTPTGLLLAPLRKNEVMSPEDFQKLPEEEHKRIEEEMAWVKDRLRAVMRELPEWEKTGRDKLKELNREVTMFAVGHLIEAVRKKYAELPEVEHFLGEMQQDVIESVDEFVAPAENPLAALIGAPQPEGKRGAAFLRRYQVNLLVGHDANHGSPVIYEDDPSFPNLVGKVEYMAHLGAVSTDFNLIRGGALHRANGGYLILDARKVLLQPYAWEGLKRCLRAREIQIKSLGQMLGLVSTMSLEPEPIPLQLKVVLIGERLLYYLLCQYDPDFNEFFKVAVDFDERMDRSEESNTLYARLVATLAREEKLSPLDRDAVARVIEHSSRLVGDAEKLSTHRMAVIDLLREADYWARQAGRPVIGAPDVQRAIDSQIYRSDRVRERLQEEIRRGTILIDTAGEKVGQVNGLSVIGLGKFSFGQPSRITARVRLGKGEVVDIEREVELSGPIHSKGVLILSGFLGARYAIDHPLSLSASLVFEQSYGLVEGDSASSAELYALLSALSGAPIRQSLAVTGSVNQHGQVQAIGGVNEKIEGFFDVCGARGLSGDQGVLIPASNVKHLMLRRDVVEAVRAEKFHIYSVETINQGIEILTGVPAGERDAAGKFPPGSINARVEERLVELAEKRVEALRKIQPENQA
jgi:RNA 3'-phosphate cyclase